MAAIYEGKSWTTDDALGIGGLLISAYRMARLIAKNGFTRTGLLAAVLDDALTGLGYFVANSPLNLSSGNRLAFRELALAIGLQAVGRLWQLVEQYQAVFRKDHKAHSHIQSLGRYEHLSGAINEFWF
jgi:hypothetical protein